MLCYKLDVYDRLLKYWLDDFNKIKYGDLYYRLKIKKLN